MRFRLAAAGLLAAAAYGQATVERPVFEAADIRVSARGTRDSGGSLRAGRTELLGKTMLSLITMAYGVDGEKVAGGPSWLDTTRFDIIAKGPAGASREALTSMLRNLLADRFQLETHKEDRPSPVFALTVARQGRLKASAPDQPTDCNRSQEGFVITLACHNMTVSALAETVHAAARNYFTHPLVDRTNLKGEYDFTLQWIPKGRVGIVGADGAPDGMSVFEALEKQLGLKVEEQSAPATLLVVDRVNDKPSANPPGTLEKIPPPATEFEVASVRPSRPGAEEDFSIRNGRIDATGASLKRMILFANNLDDDSTIIGGEKWLETDKFDIVAKASPDVSIEDLRGMLNSLLKERFQLAVHIENQPSPVFALTLPNKKSPKLKDADPSVRSGCKLGVDNGLRMYTCQNTTMEQFAAKIRSVAQIFLDHRVVDLTGLKGAYDFTVSWSPANRMPGSAPGASAPTGGAVPSAAEPAVLLTLSEAVEKQLGLKLAPQKYPMPSVVIDHVRRTPTEN